MPYLFTCPHCQTRTEVEDAYSGLSGKCVVCGNAISLPHFATTAGRDRSNTRDGTSSARRPAAWIASAVLVLAIVGVGLIALARIGATTATRLQLGRDRLGSIRNLETIAAAMNAYALDHGTYPPPVVRDETGQPLHSWRVLLLPYLGEDELYNRIDLKRPWDDEVNRVVTFQLPPAVYRHPSSQGWSLETAYVLVTGPGTLFPALGPLAPAQIRDGADQTILVAEAQMRGRASQWTEPVDLDVLAVAGTIDTNPGSDLGGVISGGVCVATADGRGHFIDSSTPPLTVQALLTPTGNEPLPDDVLD